MSEVQPALERYDVGICVCGNIWDCDTAVGACESCGANLCVKCISDQCVRDVCKHCLCPRWNYREHAGSDDFCDFGKNGHCNLHPKCHCKEMGVDSNILVCDVCQGHLIPDTPLLEYLLTKTGFTRDMLTMEYRSTKDYHRFLLKRRMTGKPLPTPKPHREHPPAKVRAARSRSRSPPATNVKKEVRAAWSRHP